MLTALASVHRSCLPACLYVCSAECSGASLERVETCSALSQPSALSRAARHGTSGGGGG